MKGFVLFIISIVLFSILGPIGFVYSLIEGIIHPSKLGKKAYSFFLGIAISIDQLGNVICGRMFNDILIKKGGYKFGEVDETISSCLGKNQRDGTLSIFGKVIAFILDTIDKDHCKKSIESF